VREEPDFYNGLRDRPLVEARALRITHLGAPASPATPDRCWHPCSVRKILEALAQGEPSIDVKRRLADTVFAADIRRLHPRLLLPQDRNDLLFREPRSLHRPSPSLGRTLALPGGVSGGHVRSSSGDGSFINDGSASISVPISGTHPRPRSLTTVT